MIYQAMQLMRSELKTYLTSLPTPDSVDVSLGSVTSGAAAQVLLTLVNVEEEAALRNTNPFQRNAITGALDVVNPPVFLNLFVLVAACPGTGTGNYDTALQRLGRVVECFQQKKQLSMANVADVPSDKFEGAAALRVSLDLYSLSFEKASQLWSTLGGQQLPGVLYKLRVVEEQGTSKLGQGPAITGADIRPVPMPTTIN